MRTTLTLDDDVAAILERLRKSRDATLKNLVNEALRRGLEPHGANVCRRDQSRLAGCELQSSTTLAKPSPLPRAKPTSDIGDAWRRVHASRACETAVCIGLTRLSRNVPPGPFVLLPKDLVTGPAKRCKFTCLGPPPLLRVECSPLEGDTRSPDSVGAFFMSASHCLSTFAYSRSTGCFCSIAANHPAPCRQPQG